MENKNISNSELLKYGLSYVPLISFVFIFTEQNKSKELLKHIKYWSFLFLAFVLIRFVLVWILMIPLSWVLFIIYAWVSGYFWYKAYKWENVTIEYIDEFEKKVKNNLNWDEKKYNSKNEEDKEKNKDDVLDF